MEEPPVEELRMQPLPQAGKALHDSIPVILMRWRDSVKRILPQVDEMTRRQLEDSLPD